MTRRCLLSLGLVSLLSAAACGSSGAPTPVARDAAAGVEVLRIQLLAGEDLARLDYRVVDYEKARRSMEQAISLFPESVGASPPLAVADIGTLGPLQQRPSRAPRLQFILFANRGRALRRGTTAVLAIGGTRITGIPVS